MAVARRKVVDSVDRRAVAEQARSAAAMAAHTPAEALHSRAPVAARRGSEVAEQAPRHAATTATDCRSNRIVSLPMGVVAECLMNGPAVRREARIPTWWRPSTCSTNYMTLPLGI